MKGRNVSIKELTDKLLATSDPKKALELAKQIRLVVTSSKKEKKEQVGKRQEAPVGG